MESKSKKQKLDYEYKEEQLHLAAKMKDRQLDQVPDLVTTYEEEFINSETGEPYMVTVRVFPNEPSPMANLKPAYAYGSF